MRRAWCAMALLATVQAWAAETPSPWYPSGEALAAIAKRQEAEFKAARAYYEREMIGQFLTVGDHNPAWKKEALEVFRITIDGRVGDSNDQGARLRRALNACVPLRPQDPFICYQFARSMEGTAATPQQQRAALQDAVDRVVASGYKGPIRFIALCRSVMLKAPAAGQEPNKITAAVAEAVLQQAFEEAVAMAQAKDLPDCEIWNMLALAGQTSQVLYHDRWRWMSKIYDVLVKYRGETAHLLACKGNLFVDYAWDARGDGWASTVTDEGWRLMRDRLATAETTLLAAWEKDPQCPGASRGMMRVELGQSKGRQVMETWFKRAVVLDPASACEHKRYYLEGKWHGSDRQMLGWAREVAAAAPKASKDRWILVTAHLSLASARHRAAAVPGHRCAPQEVESEYFKASPGAWAELRAMADDVLFAEGTSNYMKAEMGRIAVSAGDLEAARRYLDAVDEELALCEYGDEYVRLRTVVDAPR